MKSLSKAAVGEASEQKKKPAGKHSLGRVVFYVLMVTIVVTATSLAKYITTSPNNSLDGSRVAGFHVQVDTVKARWSEDDNDFDYVDEDWEPDHDFDDESRHNADGYLVYTFTATNKSEVAVKAKINIDSALSGLGTKEVWIEGDTDGWVVADGELQTVTPKDVFFEPNDIHPKVFTVTVYGEEEDINGEGHVVDIRVDCEQVD